MVDVETGDEPRPLRTLDEEPSARPPERPGSGVGNGRAVKRPSSKPDGAGSHHKQRKGSAQPTPRSAQSPSRIPETDSNPGTFGTDELLWLEEPPGATVDEPGDGSAKLPPWRRGLRG